MRILKGIVFILVCGALLLFTVENLETLSQPTVFRFDLKFWGIESTPLPLGGYLFIAFLLGFLTGALFVGGIKLRAKRKDTG